MSGKPPTHGGVRRSTRTRDHVVPSSSLYVVDGLRPPPPHAMSVQYSRLLPFGPGPHAIAAWIPNPRPEPAPGCRFVVRQVRPPSPDMRMTVFVPHAAAPWT